MSDLAPTPADWYPDPDAPQTQLRYWDGAAWTEHRHPLQAATRPDPRGPGRNMLITLAGVAFVVAGFFRASSAGMASIGGSTGSELNLLVAATIEGLAMGAAYFFFFRARFPRPHIGTTIVTWALVVLYVVSGLMSSIFPMALIATAGLMILGLGIAFGVMAATNRALPTAFRTLPLVMYAAILFGGVISASAGGFVVIGVGIAYIVLAGRVKPGLEAAGIRG